MARNSRRRKPLSAKLDKQLLAYAAMAAAGLMTGVTPANAEIIFTPTDVQIGPHATFALDIDNDGHPNLLFLHRLENNLAFLSVQGEGSFQDGVAVARPYPNSFSALAVPRGQQIGNSRYFVDHILYSPNGPSLAGYAMRAGGGSVFGNFANTQNQYLGVNFLVNGQTHYGWVRVSVHVQGTSITAHISGYAYETTVNKPIRAGQTSERNAESSLQPTIPPSQKEEPSLGILALGSAGFAFRGRESSATR